jgi:hypothetical protein
MTIVLQKIKNFYSILYGWWEENSFTFSDFGLFISIIVTCGWLRCMEDIKLNILHDQVYSDNIILDFINENLLDNFIWVFILLLLLSLFTRIYADNQKFWLLKQILAFVKSLLAFLSAGSFSILKKLYEGTEYIWSNEYLGTIRRKLSVYEIEEIADIFNKDYIKDCLAELTPRQIANFNIWFHNEVLENLSLFELGSKTALEYLKLSCDSWLVDVNLALAQNQMAREAMLAQDAWINGITGVVVLIIILVYIYKWIPPDPGPDEPGSVRPPEYL